MRAVLSLTYWGLIRHEGRYYIAITQRLSSFICLLTPSKLIGLNIVRTVEGHLKFDGFLQVIHFRIRRQGSTSKLTSVDVYRLDLDHCDVVYRD